MENNETNSFIDDRTGVPDMAVLDPDGRWRPDPVRGLNRVYARDRARAISRRRRWTWTLTTASAACIVLLAVSAPQACAWGACLKPAALTGANPTVANNAAPENFAFKTSGSASAPITLEIYSDYQCPYCARFYDETVPLILTQYVATGKVKLIHHDLPLPQHAWAKLAARYANAAGELGQYDLAVSRIFQTQGAWRDNGNIDAQLAQVLPSGLMQKVRERVMNDATLDHSILDRTIAVDLEMAGKDHINQTPSLVVEAKGKRENLSPPPAFGVLKNYLDQLLRQ
jgi:protein-disulfide isomerase